MVLDPAWNWAVGTLVGTYDASATSFVLATGDGSRFPDPATYGAYNCVVWLASTYPAQYDDPNREIVRVHAKSGDTLSSVTRGQETTRGGLAASTKDVAGGTYKIAMVPTAKFRDDTEGAAVDIGTNTVYVSETGAIGDGIADDTAAIQAAIDLGYDIVFPPGVYKVSNELTLKSNLRLRGGGMGLTTIKFAASVSGSKNMFYGAALSKVSIRDMTLDGNAANNSTTLDGIRLNGMSIFSLENLEIIEHRGNGISLGVASGTTNYGTIHAVHIRNCRSHCIEVQNRNSNNIAISISNCKLVYPGNSGGSGKAALALSGRANVSNTHVEDVRDNNYGIWFLDDDGTKGAGAHDARLVNCTVHGATHATNICVGVKVDSDGCSITNVYVKDCDYDYHLLGDSNTLTACRGIGGDKGVYVEGDHNEIVSCVFSGGVNAIDVETTADDTTIRDNRIAATGTKVITDGTNIHARNNNGWKTHARIASTNQPGDTPTAGTVSIAHGMDIVPTVESCVVSTIVTGGTYTGSFRTSDALVIATDGTNVDTRFFINGPTAGVTFKMVVDVDVYP